MPSYLLNEFAPLFPLVSVDDDVNVMMMTMPPLTTATMTTLPLMATSM